MKTPQDIPEIDSDDLPTFLEAGAAVLDGAAGQPHVSWDRALLDRKHTVMDVMRAAAARIKQLEKAQASAA